MSSVKGSRHFFRSSDSVKGLPLRVPDTRPRPTPSRLPRRCFRLLLILFLSSWALLWLYYHQPRPSVLPPVSEEEDGADHSLPPLYAAYHDYERHLPQHNLSLPFPEGRDAKFLWVANHAIASGWGNVMQELLLLALVSYETNRAFVFDNYTWARDDRDYGEFNGKLIPGRIPLSALISGPIIGSTFDPGDPTPRSVHKEYFKQICPNPTVLDPDAVVGPSARYDISGSQMLDMWVEKINSVNDPCIEISSGLPAVFDIWLFGSTRVLSIWPRLSRSPILRNFSWSPLVLQAFARNAHLFGAPTKTLGQLPTYLRPSSPPVTSKELHNVDPLLPAIKIDPIPGLLVLHIRRGDFADHCVNLASWGSEWNGFNRFATLPDKFRPLQDGSASDMAEAQKQHYLQRCFPTIEQIVARVREVLSNQAKVHGSTRDLTRVYIMTNGDAIWLSDLKDALMGIKKWESVTGSRDLRLGWEEKPVAQAMDMLVGQYAQVFIGNGFSSLTSNIVLFRMLKELPPEDTRFW